MKVHVHSVLKTFQNGCDRADGLRHLHDYLTRNAPPALNCDDILRSAIVLVVSSFDLFIHDIFRLEVLHRLSSKKEVIPLRIPFNSLLLDGAERMAAIEECIRNENSYKSFVAPDKLAECLRALFDAPWDKIAEFYGESALDCKKKLKSIIELRNRIAHEADVNPIYNGIELWPIYSQDVEKSISYLRSLGGAIAKAVEYS